MAKILDINTQLKGYGIATFAAGLSIMVLIFTAYKIYPLLNTQQEFKEAKSRVEYLQEVGDGIVRYLKKRHTNTYIASTEAGHLDSSITDTLIEESLISRNTPLRNAFGQRIEAVYSLNPDGNLIVHVYYTGGISIEPRKLAHIRGYNLYLTHGDGIVPIQDIINHDTSRKRTSFGYDLGNKYYLATELQERIFLKSQEYSYDTELFKQAYVKYKTLNHQNNRANIILYQFDATNTEVISKPHCVTGYTKTLIYTLDDIPKDLYDYQINLDSNDIEWTLNLYYSTKTNPDIFKEYDQDTGKLIVSTGCKAGA